MASETTPRIPAQPTMTGAPFQVGFRLPFPDPRRQQPRQERRREHPDEPGHDDDQEDARPRTRRHRRPSYSPRPFRTTGSCSPISAKTADSRMKATIFQTASSWSRVAKSTCQARWPR